MRNDRAILLASALAVAFGLQDLRALFPSMVYVLKDRLGMTSVALGVIGVAWFALAGAAAAWASRGALPRTPAAGRGATSALAAAIAGTAGLRAALQVWPGDPIGFLILAALGTLASFAVLAALLGRGAPSPAAAFLGGAAIDVALHAARTTEDWHWAHGFPDLGIVALALGASILAACGGRGPGDEADDAGGATPGAGAARTGALASTTAPAPTSAPARSSAAAGFVWGPLLFRHLEWLANVARLSAKTGLRSELAGAAILGGLACALIAAAMIPAGRAARWGAGLALVAATSFAGRAGLAAIPIQAAAFVAAALVLREATSPAAHAAFGTAKAPRFPRAAAGAMGCGSVVLLLLVFAHYPGYDLPLPWSRAQVWVAAAVIIAACAVAAPRPDAPAPRGSRLLPIRAALLPALLGIGLAVASSLPRGRTAAELSALPSSVRIVTFNLHAGFDERGGFAFAAMMDSLRAQNAEVVALQEVSRGWLINGCADLYELARRKLEKGGGAPAAYAFGASIDTDWGNAVFAAAPIARFENVPLPPRDLELTRAVLDVEIPATASPVPLRVLATHFHHRETDESAREEQAHFLVERYGSAGATDGFGVLLGDFNAPPRSPSWVILERAGWHDAAHDAARDGGSIPSAGGTLGAAPGSPAPTYPSRAPERRIDAIFVRGAAVRESDAAPAWGSDHRAVKATISRRADPLSDRSP